MLFSQMAARHGLDRPELEDPRVMSLALHRMGWKLEMWEFKNQ